MPHMSSGGSEDFYSTDEVKVYKDEGNKDEEKRSSENLSEEKLGLVTESEEGKNASLQGNYGGSDKGNGSRVDDDKVAGGTSGQGQPQGSMGFFLPPYASYPNGGGKFGMVQPPYPGLVMYNDYTQPPPAHMGIPPVHTDPKTGLPRPPMYAAYPPHSQFSHPLYGPDFPQVPWPRPAGYPITTAAFSGSYPPSLSISRYGHPSLLPPGIPHPGMPHPGMLPGNKSDMMGSASMQDGHRLDGQDERGSGKSSSAEKRKNYIKKPLNAFMLFMKEMRPKVIAECTLRESSAINQILGRKWHALDRSEQAKYYEMARKEKDLHMQLYPGWSARDSYAVHQKKKKRKKTEPSLTQENKTLAAECPNAKKCRARYGMDQQSQWCKPCRRKKKCIRYLREDGDNSDGENYDDGSSHLGSQRSTCDTDSTHDPEADSPRPDGGHLALGQQQSPLSPLLPDEREEMAADASLTLNLGFPASSTNPPSSSSPFSLLSSLPSQPCPSPPPSQRPQLSLSSLPLQTEWSAAQMSMASTGVGTTS